MGSTPCRCSSIEPVQDVDPLKTSMFSQDSVDQQTEKIQNPKSFLWPLPSNRSETSFEMNWSTDLSGFYDKMRTRIDSATTKLSTRVDFRQKETNLFESIDTDSTQRDSAQVQSTLRSEFRSSLELSTNDGIDQISTELTEIQKKFDNFLQREFEIITKNAEEILKSIRNETRENQQNLLIYGKQRQTRDEKLFNEFLQKYVVVLNEWKSNQLTNLQNDLEQYKNEIVNNSKSQIQHVNDEVNDLRDEVSKNVSKKLSQQTKKLIEKYRSKPSFQLGQETVTKIDLTIQTNCGKKISE